MDRYHRDILCQLSIELLLFFFNLSTPPSQTIVYSKKSILNFYFIEL